MKPHHNPSSMLFVLVPLLISINIPISIGADDGRYTNCRSSSFSCGSIQSLRYPFWGGERENYCGQPDFQRRCESNIPMITVRSLKYQLLHLDWTTQTLVVARDDYFDPICPTDYRNNTFDQTPFKYVDRLTGVTFLYNCPNSSSTLFPSTTYNKNCKRADGTAVVVYYILGLAMYSSDCKSSIMTIYAANLGRAAADIQYALQHGFGLQWMVNNEDCNTCSQSGGQCGYYEGQFSCFCKDGPQKTLCSEKSSGI